MTPQQSSYWIGVLLGVYAGVMLCLAVVNYRESACVVRLPPGKQAESQPGPAIPVPAIKAREISGAEICAHYQMVGQGWKCI